MKNIYKIDYDIYITDDSEIKDVRPHKGKWQLEGGLILNKLPDYLTDLSECKLIIMTTDPELIADGVQAIDDEFLKWFVKNPSCKEVEVEEEDYSQKCRECGEPVKRGYSCNRGCFMKSGNFIPTDKNVKYKIIIPKEEPKQDFTKGEKVYLKEDNNVSQVVDDNTKDWRLWEREAKQRIHNYKPMNPHPTSFFIGFIAGAKSDAAKEYWYKKFWEDYNSQFKNQIDEQ